MAVNCKTYKMKRILRIISIAVHETVEGARDQGVLIFILLLPLVYPLLYAAIYRNEMVKEVPTAVVDECNSLTSRELVRRFDATDGIDVVSRCANMDEAQQQMRQMKVFAILRIPRDYSSDLAQGRQTNVGVYINMASSLYYKSVLLAANNVVMDTNKDISVQRMGGTTTEREREVMRQPIAFEYRPLYNPQSGFASFLIPPVLMLILQQTLLLGIGMSMGRSRETYRRQMHTLYALYQRPFEIIIGKSIPYFALYVIMASYAYLFVGPAFGLPSVGDYWTFLTFVVPFLLASIFMGVVLSCLVFRREDCILLFVTLSVPMLFISGIVWPADQIPVFWRYIGYALPSTWGMNAYVKHVSMGADYSQIQPEIRNLWILAAAYFVTACALYKWRLTLVKRKLTTLFADES